MVYPSYPGTSHGSHTNCSTTGLSLGDRLTELCERVDSVPDSLSRPLVGSASSSALRVEGRIVALENYVRSRTDMLFASQMMLGPLDLVAGKYTRTTHSNPQGALEEVQSRYRNIAVIRELVEERTGTVEFSSVCDWKDAADHGHEWALTRRGLTVIECWVASSGRKDGQWAMVSFDAPTAVVGFATAGRPAAPKQHVQHILLEYYDREERTWRGVLQANTDQHSVVAHTLPEPIVTRRVRIVVKCVQDHPAMRFEVYGWQ
ncbi:hypothetical protein KIPB_002950 [Kipferlia bialata]|uniref:F5/8 type C domain-containing protein n=1 Tax=Kipferlia bialata TaxID=797122 RepID=A0A9K3CT41_9EUKA|nr:hypothetical protein KIPB_002950 [Kipferlia bialata]|eukprot:g2950.t1